MMTDNPADDEDLQPTSQQELNLAMMDSIRHLGQYVLDVSALTHMIAGKEIERCLAAGDEAGAEAMQDQAEKARKNGLRFHNSMIDTWEAFAKDSGPLLNPREVPARVKVDD